MNVEVVYATETFFAELDTTASFFPGLLGSDFSAFLTDLVCEDLWPNPSSVESEIVMVDLSFFSYIPACTITLSVILLYSSLDWILSSQLFVISFLELLVHVAFLCFSLDSALLFHHGAITAILKRNTIIRRKPELIISWMSFVIKNIHLSIECSIFPKN